MSLGATAGAQRPVAATKEAPLGHAAQEPLLYEYVPAAHVVAEARRRRRKVRRRQFKKLGAAIPDADRDVPVIEEGG